MSGGGGGGGTGGGGDSVVVVGVDGTGGFLILIFLSFLDFFSVGAGGKAVTISSSCCKGLFVAMVN